MDMLGGNDLLSASTFGLGAAAKRAPFYSKLSRVIAEKMPNRADSKTVTGLILNPQTGIKSEEIKWSGIMTWLTDQRAQGDKIDKQAVLDYLASEGAVRMEEVRLQEKPINYPKLGTTYMPRAADTQQGFGVSFRSMDEAQQWVDRLVSMGGATQDQIIIAEYPDSGNEPERVAEIDRQKLALPKFSQYQLPGGENYREVVLAMPVGVISLPEGSEIVKLDGEWFVKHPSGIFDGLISRVGSTSKEGARGRALAELNKVRSGGQGNQYTSSHFPDVPNYVAHARLNDRTDAEGRPGTFIEEIQSDRHQAGREKGYQNDEARMTNDELPEGYEVREGGTGKFEVWGPSGYVSGTYAATQAESIAKAQERIKEGYNAKIPDAPFRTTWPLQMFKRALAEAVAAGKQWIGWTTGETQAERYDLSKQINSIAAFKGDHWPEHIELEIRDKNDVLVVDSRAFEVKKLPDTIGKELAERIIGDLNEDVTQTRYSGLDLKVGGEGMKGFYDTILPKEIGKYVKQWGAGVVKGEIVSDKDAQGNWATTKEEGTTPIWRVNITPQMKAGVEAGQALFSAAKRSSQSPSLPVSKSPVDAAAHEAATSPLNDLKPPTKAQQDEGNYKKGHPVIGGHAISIENPAGSKRRPEWPALKDHYGYIRSVRVPKNGFAQSSVTDSETASNGSEAFPGLQAGIDAGKVVTDLVAAVSNIDLPSAEDAAQSILVDPKSSGYLSARNAFANELLRRLEIPRDGSRKGIESQFLEATRDGLAADSKLFGDGVQGMLLRTQGFDALDIQGKSMVERHVRSAIKNPQVLRAIVQLVPVDVMNMLGGRKIFSTEDDAVLLERFTAALDNPVMIGRLIDGVAASLPAALALRIAERVGQSVKTPLATMQNGSATGTGNGGHESPSTRVSPKGKDGDHVDVFVKPGTPTDFAGDVYVVRQITPATGRFDEWKVMMGYDSITEAEQAYRRNYTPGWKGLDSIAALPMAEFTQSLAAGAFAQAGSGDQVLASGAKRGQGAAMADPDKAAQNAEPSPGGLSEAEISRYAAAAKGRQVAVKKAHTELANLKEKRTTGMGWEEAYSDPEEGGVDAVPEGETANHWTLTPPAEFDNVNQLHYDIGSYENGKVFSITKSSKGWGDTWKEYPTLEQAKAAAEEDFQKEAGEEWRGVFGSNIDSQEAIKPIFDHFALPDGVEFQPGTAWGVTKWGSWYAYVRGYDIKRGEVRTLKLSVRDHDASRKDMGLPDLTAEVSKNWTPEEVAAALNRLEQKVWKRLQSAEDDPSSGPDDNERTNQKGGSLAETPQTQKGARGSPPTNQGGGFPGAKTPSQPVHAVPGRGGNREADRGRSGGNGSSGPVLGPNGSMNFPPQGGSTQNTHTNGQHRNRRQDIANTEGDSNRPSQPSGSQFGGLPPGTESRTSSEQPRRPAGLGPAGQVDQGSRGLSSLADASTGSSSAGTLASAAKRGPVEKVASAVFAKAPVAIGSGIAKAGAAVVEKAGLQQVLAKMGSNNFDKFISKVVFGKVAKWDKVQNAKQAVEVWLGRPGALSKLAKGALDQTVPLWNVPREWLAAYHESQRKAAWGREKAMDVIRALSHNAKVSDLAYPQEFVEDPAWRVKLFDAMEGKAEMTTLPQPLQDLAARLRKLLKETGQELVRQGIMSLDTFEELSATGWMPRYTEEEAEAAGGSWLKAFKLGVKDLVAHRSTAWHVVDTTRKEKDGQYAIVSRDEGGKRNRWRFRNEQHRNAWYEDFIKGEAVKMLTTGGKDVTSLLAALDNDATRAVREEIKGLTREKIDRPAELSENLRNVVRRAVELQRFRYKKEAPFEPDNLIKDPVYAVARYVMGATHNAATMELLKQTAKQPEWVSDVALAGYTQMPDNDRFGPLAGKHVKDEIARQILDLVDVPGTVLGMYDAILRTWKAGKLVLNPGSHIRDAVGNVAFSVLAGTNPLNPGNLPYYRDAIAALRDGGDAYAELIEMQVLGGDAFTTEVKTALKGLLPDTKTLEKQDAGKIMRLIMGVGGAARGAYEWAAAVRQVPDNLYKTAAYLKFKAQGMSPAEAAAEVRKWFPYYDRLGSSGLIKQGSRFVMPFSSFFRESTRILGRGAVERPLAMASILGFASGITQLSLMILGLGDEDEESVFRSMRGKLKLGLSGDRPVFSMLLPNRTDEGQLQQWDISSVLPFADLLGTRVEMRQGEDEWTKFWRGLFTQSPIFSTVWAWSTNTDAFSGRKIVEEDMGMLESTKERLREFGDTMLPPLTPWFGVHSNTIANAGRRMSSLDTRNATQSYLRAIVGLDVRSADPNLRTETEFFRKEKNLPLANSGSLYATPLKSRLGRQIKGELIQDAPNIDTVADALLRLEESGNPIKTRDDMEKLLKGLDPDRLIKEEYRRKLVQSFSPEALRVWRSQQSEFKAAQRRLPSVMKEASPLAKARRASVSTPVMP